MQRERESPMETWKIELDGITGQFMNVLLRHYLNRVCTTQHLVCRRPQEEKRAEKKEGGKGEKGIRCYSIHWARKEEETDRSIGGLFVQRTQNRKEKKREIGTEKQRHFQEKERKEKTVLIRRFKCRFVSSRIKTGLEESPPFPFHANCKSWQFISSDNIRQCGIISSPLSLCTSH